MKNNIPVEEEEMETNQEWREEFSSATDELYTNLKRLVSQANVQRVIVKQGEKELFDIPVYAGVAGILLLGPWSMLLLVAGMVTECSIIVVRREPVAAKEAPKAEAPVAAKPEKKARAKKAAKEAVATPATTATTTVKAKAPKKVKAAPKAKVAPVTKGDDFTKIKGVGPKASALLHQNGITTFAQLSDSSVEAVQAILDKGGRGYRLADPTNWPSQAREFVG